MGGEATKKREKKMKEREKQKRDTQDGFAIRTEKRRREGVRGEEKKSKPRVLSCPFIFYFSRHSRVANFASQNRDLTVQWMECALPPSLLSPPYFLFFPAFLPSDPWDAIQKINFFMKFNLTYFLLFFSSFFANAAGFIFFISLMRHFNSSQIEWVFVKFERKSTLLTMEMFLL